MSARSRRVVPGITLDAFVDRVGLARVDLIKIDVEGGELEALRGAAGVLERHHPDLIVEVLATNDPDPDLRSFRTQRAEALWALASGLGYRLWQVPSHGPLEPLDRLVADAPAEDANYLFSTRGQADLAARGCRFRRAR